MRLIPPSARRRRGAPPLQLTSMIDVIFLLLIYFILTSTYQAPESQLSPTLQAEQSAAGRSELTPQVVEATLIEGEPGFRIGSRVIRARRELTDVLAMLPKQPGVVIKASDRVATRWAAVALQAARDAGFVKVTYVPAE